MFAITLHIDPVPPHAHQHATNIGEILKLSQKYKVHWPTMTHACDLLNNARRLGHNQPPHQAVSIKSVMERILLQLLPIDCLIVIYKAGYKQPVFTSLNNPQMVKYSLTHRTQQPRLHVCISVLRCFQSSDSLWLHLAAIAYTKKTGTWGHAWIWAVCISSDENFKQVTVSTKAKWRRFVRQIRVWSRA